MAFQRQPTSPSPGPPKPKPSPLPADPVAQQLDALAQDVGQVLSIVQEIQSALQSRGGPAGPPTTLEG